VARLGELDVDGRLVLKEVLKNKGMRVCSVFEGLRLEGGGHGDESLCSVKHEERIFSLLRVLMSKEMSCMHLSCVN